jgi:hypothetical protein
MTRLALAKTIVTGSMTLQGNTFSFTASASGTAKADKVPEAKKLAVAASNNAAITAARASIDKILLNNSAVLSDLEITSLISNNLSTTVVVFKPIALATIASSSNGINYTLNPTVTIGSNQWLTVPSGKTLYSTADNPLINNGYVQIGDGTQTSSGALKDSGCSSFPATNNRTINVSSGECYTVDVMSTVTNAAYEASITNHGTINNYGIMDNTGDNSYILSYCGALLNNYGNIENNGDYSYVTAVCPSDSCVTTFLNDGVIHNNVSSSYSGNTTGVGQCEGTGCNTDSCPPPPQ